MPGLRDCNCEDADLIVAVVDMASRVEALRSMIKPDQIIGYRQGGEPEDKRDHFYACAACGQMVDMRDLGQLFHHEIKGHQPLPEETTTWPPANNPKRRCRSRVERS